MPFWIRLMLKTEVSRFTMNNARGIHLGQLWVFLHQMFDIAQGEAISGFEQS